MLRNLNTKRKRKINTTHSIHFIISVVYKIKKIIKFNVKTVLKI